MNKKSDEPVCVLDYAFKRMGGKYKSRVLWYIHKSGGVLRYGELKRLLQNITPKMLTQTLRELEEDGLINRKAYPEVPPRVEYTLTETGIELLPFIEQLGRWARKELEKVNHPLVQNVI